jgi:hypothetical protein
MWKVPLSYPSFPRSGGESGYKLGQTPIVTENQHDPVR